MLTSSVLRSKVDALWDRFWSGGISNPLTAIEQMSYLIFLKRLEDMDDARAAAAKRRKTEYQSIFSSPQPLSKNGEGKRAGRRTPLQHGEGTGVRRELDKAKCRWSYWSQLPGDEMLRHVRDVVFEFLRTLGSETSTFTQHMQDAMFIIPKASLLQEAVKIIDPE